jgi:hypothetical protein
MEKKTVKKIGKFIAFFIIANLPFLTMTQLLGMDTFLDSFEHPDSYRYLKNTDSTAHYLIIEKQTTQSNDFQTGDNIAYRTTGDKLVSRIINKITVQHGIISYYTTNPIGDDLDGPIFEEQILGKIKGTTQDNIWNALCLQVWDTSIHNLNAVELFTNIES